MKIYTILAGAVGLTALAAVVPVQRSTLTERLRDINTEINQTQAQTTPTAPTTSVPAAVIIFMTNSWHYEGQLYLETGVKVDFVECSSNAPALHGGMSAADAIAISWGVGLTNKVHDQFGELILTGWVKK